MKLTSTHPMIGELLEPVRSWNPIIEAPSHEIDYIDIASVDRETKSITAPSVILGSNAPSRARQIICQGDVLVSTVRPNLNAVAYVESQFDKATASTGFCVLRANPEKVNPRYLYRWVTTPQFIREMTSKASGQSYPAVSDSIIKKSEIPLPPLEEQKRIAAILDKADALRRKRAEALRLTDDFLQSVFLDMFGDPVTNPKGWPIHEVGELAERVVVGHVGPTSENYTAGGIAFLRTGNVRRYRVDTREMQSITIAFHQKLKKSTLRTNDVLISRVGANRGMAAVLPASLDGANCANIVIATPGDRLRSHYLAYLVNSDLGQRDLLSGTVGSAQGVINTSSVKSWKIPIPPSNLQDGFCTIVLDSTAANEKAENQQIQMGELFESLVQRAFRGDI